MAAPQPPPGPAPAGKPGNVFTRKLGPFPAWVWMAIAAVLVLLFVVYEYIKGGQGSSSGQQGGMNAPYLTPPVVVMTPPDSDDDSGTGDKDPHHHHHRHGHRPPPGTKEITVTKDETLGQLAKYLHWSKSTLAAVEEMNAAGGKELTASSQLTKGQTIIRPVKG